MLYFIPAWYKKNKWVENEQRWYIRREKSEFDETIKQITLFHRNVKLPYQILLLSFSPNLRHFLHRQGMYRASYWSCFDAIQQIHRSKIAILSYKDIMWPQGVEFVYSPFAIVAFLRGQKYATINFGDDGNPISIVMYENNEICRKNYYDDRGFIGATAIYQDGEEIYRDFLMEMVHGKCVCFSRMVMWKSIQQRLFMMFPIKERHKQEHLKICIMMRWMMLSGKC